MKDDPIFEKVVSHVQTALSATIDGSRLIESTELSALGMDSLLVINVLLGLSIDYAVDLANYVDSMEPPKTFGDLIRIATTFAEEIHAA